MSRRYTASWVAAARESTVFAKRFQQTVAHRTRFRRSVTLRSNAFAYHGYLAFIGGSLSRGFEAAASVADVVSELAREIGDSRTPEPFRLYMRAWFTGPTDRKGASGKIKETSGGRMKWDATQNATRYAGQWSAGVDAWLAKHAGDGVFLYAFHVSFLTLTPKRQAKPKRAPVKIGQKSKRR